MVDIVNHRHGNFEKTRAVYRRVLNGWDILSFAATTGCLPYGGDGDGFKLKSPTVVELPCNPQSHATQLAGRGRLDGISEKTYALRRYLISARDGPPYQFER